MPASPNRQPTRKQKSWTDANPKETIWSKRLFLGFALIAFISLFAYLVLVFVLQGARVHFASLRIRDYGDRFPQAEFGSTDKQKADQLLLSGGYKPWDYVHELGDIKNNSDLLGALQGLLSTKTNSKHDTWIVQFRCHAKVKLDSQGKPIVDTLIGETNESNSLSLKEVIERLQLLPAKHVILLADICDLANSIPESQSPIHEEIAQICQSAAEVPGSPKIWILLSAASRQPALRSSIKGQTLFQAACEAAISQPVESDYLSLAEFYSRVSNYCYAASEHIQCPLLWQLGMEKPIPQVANNPCELVPVAWKSKSRALSKTLEGNNTETKTEPAIEKEADASSGTNAKVPIPLNGESEPKGAPPKSGWNARDLIVAEAVSKTPMLPPFAISPRHWRQYQLNLLQHQGRAQDTSIELIDFYQRWKGQNVSRSPDQTPLWTMYRSAIARGYPEWRNAQNVSTDSNLSSEEAPKWYGEIRSNYVLFMSICCEARFWQEWVWYRTDLESVEQTKPVSDDFVAMCNSILAIRSRLTAGHDSLLQMGVDLGGEFQSVFKHHQNLRTVLQASIARLSKLKSLSWKDAYELDLLLSSPLLSSDDRQSLENRKKDATTLNVPSRFELPTHFSVDMSWSQLASKKQQIQNVLTAATKDTPGETVRTRPRMDRWFHDCLQDLPSGNALNESLLLTDESDKSCFLEYPGNPRRLMLEWSNTEQELKWLDFPSGNGVDQPSSSLKMTIAKANREPLERVMLPVDTGANLVRLVPPIQTEKVTVQGKECFVFPVQDQRLLLKFVLKKFPLIENDRLVIEAFTADGEVAQKEVLVTQNASRLRLLVKRNLADGTSQWAKIKESSNSHYEIEAVAATNSLTNIEFYLRNDLDKNRYVEAQLFSQSTASKRPVELAKSHRIELTSPVAGKNSQALQFHWIDQKSKTHLLGNIDETELWVDVTEWTSMETSAQKTNALNAADRWSIRLRGGNPATPEYLTVEPDLSMEATRAFWGKYRAEKLKILFDARDLRSLARKPFSPQPIELTSESPNAIPNTSDLGEAVDLYFHVGGYPRAALFRRNASGNPFEPVYQFENATLLSSQTVTRNQNNITSKTVVPTNVKWTVPNRKDEILQELNLDFALDFPSKRGSLVMVDARKNITFLQRGVNDRTIEATMQWSPESNAIDLQLTPSDRSARIDADLIQSRSDGEYVIGWLTSPEPLPSVLTDNLKLGAPFTIVRDTTPPIVQVREANLLKRDGSEEELNVQFKLRSSLDRPETIEKIAMRFPNDREAKGIELVPVPSPSKKEEFKGVAAVPPEYSLRLKQVVEGKLEVVFDFYDPAGNATSVRSTLSRSLPTSPPKIQK